jgi:hypothetical protein
MEEKASLSTVSACVLGSGKGKDKMWGERERERGEGLLGKRKGGGLWEFL